MEKIIYDFGANNGDDIPYYLMKSNVVIAVEANPDLCKLMESRFEREINNGRLIICNCVLTASNEADKVPFYIHKTNHVLSQFPEPPQWDIASFEKVSLPPESVNNIVNRYGPPHYIKIDIEHYDSEILRALFKYDIRPEFISAESHISEVFSLLVTEGHYDAFKLVEGSTVSEVYSSRQIEGEEYSFPHHSAGPYGDDVDGQWLCEEDFSQHLENVGLGWKDIHATKLSNC
jgi:FkbM family methyltransferase